MSKDLRSRLKELETTVEALTDEIVEVQQRLDELESEDGGKDEIGVGVDQEEETEDDDIDDDIYVA